MLLWYWQAPTPLAALSGVLGRCAGQGNLPWQSLLLVLRHFSAAYRVQQLSQLVSELHSHLQTVHHSHQHLQMPMQHTICVLGPQHYAPLWRMDRSGCQSSL